MAVSRFSAKAALSLVLAAVILAVPASAGGSKDKETKEQAAADASAGPSAAEGPAPGLGAESWKAKFPKEYASFMASAQERPGVNGYGGSVPVQKLDQSPELRVLFAGSGFAKDYKEDRGHPWAWEDLMASGRVNDKTPASCLTCKTPAVADIYAAEGWAYAKKPLSAYAKEGMPNISCASCHDPATGKLRLTQPAFIEAIAAKDGDPSKAGRAQMRTYVCAQCHSEYYFDPATTRVVHPWALGTSAEKELAYYKTQPGGFKADFTQPVSQAAMLKTQHPDYEEFLDGPHAQAGLSCADCHLPGGSHDMTSPLRSIDASCLGCHKARGASWLEARVKYNQDAVWSLQDQVGKDLAKTHQAIGPAAARKDASAAGLAAARESVRDAQWYWDYVAAANSMGAHNPVGALRNLAKALELSALAREQAAAAAGLTLQ